MLKNLSFKLYFWPKDQWIRAQAAIKLIAYLIPALIALQATAATQREQSGVVTRVVDGDTLWVKTSAGQPLLKVRIQGIDAPEICQAGGVAAREALKRRVLGQSVTVTSRTFDDYGRSVGILRLGGQDIGRWQVVQGHAWVYSYRRQQGPYAEELNQARLARRGVFSDAAAEEPRLFRKRRGSCHLRP